MLEHILVWLERRPHRWHTVHIILVTAILTLINQTAIMGFVGCLALSLLAMLWVAAVRQSLPGIPRPVHPFNVLLVCLPGAFAWLMASGSLWLAVYLNLHWLGLSLFCAHACLLVWIVSDHLELPALSKTSTRWS